jgi:acetyltransferase-like isoleucine patch superfamily enzyme
MAPGETWFGSPPIRLPARQRVDLGQRQTYEPGIGDEQHRRERGGERLEHAAPDPRPDPRLVGLALAEVRTGERVFVGNDAVVPPGAVIPDDVLIGIKSKPPANDRRR